eukprot:gene8153-17582_t
MTEEFWAGFPNIQDRDKVDVFVPGRVCLFGEHSDWAGGYRRVNADVVPGRCIVYGTDVGIHATVAPHPDKLIV